MEFSASAHGERAAQLTCVLFPLWDVSGTYQEGQFGLEGGLTMTQSPRGNIAGRIIVGGCGDAGCCDIAGTLGGALSSRGGVPRGTLVTRARGSCDESGPQRTTSRFVFTVNQETACLEGTISGTACARIIGGCQRVAPQDYELCLPAGMDGTARLTLDVSELAGGKAAGSATLTLSNGRVLGFRVRVPSGVGADGAKLLLRGNGDTAAGCQLVVRTANGTITSVSGRVMGQKIDQRGCP